MNLDNDNPFTGISTEAYGLIVMLLSAIIFSTMGCFLKLTGDDGYPSTELVFCRAMYQGFFVVIYMLRVSSDYEGEEPKLLIKMPIGRSMREIPTVLFRGFMGGLNFVTKFYAMLALPLGDAITLFSIHPIITVFLARIFLGEEIRYSNIFAAFCTVTGAVMMAGPTFLDNDDGVENKLGYFSAIFSSFCGASCLVLIRKAGKLGVYTSQLIFSFAFIGGFLCLILGMTIGIPIEGYWILPPSKKSFWLVLAMCAIGAFGQLTLNHGGRIAPAGLGAICRSTDIVWGYVFESIVFGQVPTFTTCIGVTLIVISIIIVALEKVKEEISLMSMKKDSTIEMEYRDMGELAHEKGVQA